MNERNGKIIARVRAKLGEIGTNNIQNEDIYDNASIVVNDMLQKMKCKQIKVLIRTKAGKEEYYLKTKHTLLIKEIFNSWDGDKLTYEGNWDNVKGLTGSYPLYYHIFADELYLSPIPSNTDDTITIWAYQTSEKNQMDDEAEPETPQSVDNVLVLGILAEFDEAFRPRYELERTRSTPLFHTKITANRVNQSHW